MKAQGALEYLLFIGGIIFFVLIVINILCGNWLVGESLEPDFVEEWVCQKEEVSWEYIIDPKEIEEKLLEECSDFGCKCLTFNETCKLSDMTFCILGCEVMKVSVEECTEWVWTKKRVVG